MFRFVRFLVTHGIALAIGFALGIYFLPILTAPADPDAATLEQQAEAATFIGTFTRDLDGSDFLHWGEGTISLTPTMIVHEGALAPGPDYKLYLTQSFVENEAQFNAVKAEAALVGDVKTFGGILLDIPSGIDIHAYDTVVIWCESFGEFITAAKYQ